MNFPWLSMLWALPVLGAVVIILLPGSARQAAKVAGLGVSLAVLVIALILAVQFDPAGERFQFVENHAWIRYFGTGYILGLDGIALALVVLTAVLVPLLMLAGWNDADDRPGLRERGPHTYVALTLAIEGMVLMSLAALDVLLFYVFFEAMLIPMYFLIGGFGQRTSATAKAAVKFLLYNLFGGLVMLAAVVGLYVVTSTSNAFENGTFDFRQIADAVTNGRFVIEPGWPPRCSWPSCSPSPSRPLWPLHRWLPDAAVQATPASAVLMMAVMDKVGTFGMLLLPAAVPRRRSTIPPFVVALAVIGIVYGAVLAIGQTDVMRLIAYTSISHFGFIILGIFAMTSQGQSGATLYMVNHGISTAALFLIAGFLVSRRGTRAIAAYGGCRKWPRVGRHISGRRPGHPVLARAGTVHQRIPGSHRHLHPVPGVRGGSGAGLGALGGVRPVDVPADHDRTADEGQRGRHRPTAPGVGRGGATDSTADRPRRVPEGRTGRHQPGVDHTLSGIHQPDPAPTDSAAAHARATSGGHR